MAKKKKTSDPLKLKGSEIDKLVSEEEEKAIQELIPFNFLEEYVNLIFNKKVSLSYTNPYNEKIDTNKIEKMIKRLRDPDMHQTLSDLFRWEQKTTRSLADEYTMNQILLTESQTPFHMIEKKYLDKNMNLLIQLKLLAFVSLNYYFPDTVQLRMSTGESNFFISNYSQDQENPQYRKARIANIENKVIEPLRNNINKHFTTRKSDSAIPIIRISTMEIQNSLIHYIIRISSDFSPICKHLMLIENPNVPLNPNLYLISDEELGFSHSPSGDLLDYYIFHNKVLPIIHYPSGVDKEETMKQYLEQMVYDYIDSLFDLEKNYIVYKFQQMISSRIKSYENNNVWKGLSKIETSIVERINNVDIPMTIKLEKVLDNYNTSKANKNYYINIIPSALKYFSTMCIVSTNPEAVLFNKWEEDRYNKKNQDGEFYYTFFLPIESFTRLKVDIISKAQKEHLFSKKTRDSEKYKNIPSIAFETETITHLIGRIVPRIGTTADEKYMIGQVSCIENSEEKQKESDEKPLHKITDDLLQKIYFDYKKYIIEKSR